MRVAGPYLEIVSGRRKGFWPACQRGGLSVLARAYGAAVGVRNCLYDRSLGVHRTVTPVISVGNLTVGGTGKTPMVVWLCEHLAKYGKRPAVVSRGYKAEPGRTGDELRLLRRRCRGAALVANPDRVVGAREAVERERADVILLDDGFQHRRLARDLDIVLIDATCPFGYGHLLPRGLLREPVSSLRRADLVILTRTDQCAETALGEMKRRLARYASEVPLLSSVHRASGFTDLEGRCVDGPDHEARIACFSAIGRPAAFESTSRSVGLNVVGHRTWPDHHAYSPADVESLSAFAALRRADALLTTEKDAVKLVELPARWPLPVRVLTVDLALPDEDAKILAGRVEKVVAGRGQSGTGHV